MALKFYLHQRDNAHEIHCNTNSTITEIAGTFDLGTMELEWNECKHAIFPNTPFIIVDTESNEEWNFIIAEDNVEVVKKTNPIKYLHRLTLSQSVHKLNNVPLRNTVFSQPYEMKKHFEKNTPFIDVVRYDRNPDDNKYYFVSNDTNIYVDTNYNQNEWIKEDYPIKLNGIEKITGAYLKISTQIITFKDSTYSSDVIPNGNIITQQNARVLNSYIQSLTIRIINYNDSNDYIEFIVSSQNLYKQINLTTNQINWLKNKQTYIKLVAGTIGNILPICLPVKDTANSLHALGFVNISLDINYFNYSLWDILNILNKQCIKQYNGSHLLNYYEMPDKTTGQGLELDSIIAPEFTFTQMDLYEAVAKVLSFIDAFPVLNENNVLGYQYLNDLSEETIEELQANDIKTTLNEENCTNKLASYYQNGKKNEPITFPAKNFFRYPTTSKFGVVDKNDWYFFVSKPIDYIDKLLIRTTTDTVNLPPISMSESWYYFRNVYLNSTTATPEKIVVDITNRIFQSDVYNNLQTGYASNMSLNRYNTLYYTRGDNKIYCGITGDILAVGTHDVLQYVIEHAYGYNMGFGNRSSIGLNYSGTKSNYSFNCTYHPILDGKVSQESTSNKVEKETIVAQANSSSELNRLGNNLQGLIAKLGNEEKSVTLPITKIKDRVKLGTHYIDELGNNWIVNRVKTTFTTNPDKVIVEATFIKNFNAMQQFTSLNQEKRFYDISERITSKGYENINEFVYFTTRSDLNEYSLATNIAFKSGGIAAIMLKTFGSSIGELNNKNTIFDMVGVFARGTSNVYTYIVPAVYGCGNQICFEMGYDNSVMAGNFVDGNNVCNAWLYTGEDGIATNFDIDGSFLDANVIYDTQWYPEITNSLPGTKIFELYHFYYYKKPNEIFHLNYSLNFLPYWTKTIDELGTPQYVYEEVFFGDKFINENGIIPNTVFENGKERKYKFWVSNKKYSIIDNKAQGTELQNVYLDADFGYTNNGVSGTSAWGRFALSDIDTDMFINISAYKSWCISDEDGNIYIAVNRNENSSDYAELKWFTSRDRKV